MDPAALKALLEGGGPFGLLALSLWALSWALSGWMRERDARIADLKEVVDESNRCITNSSQHIATSGAAVVQLTQTSERRVQATELQTAELSRVASDLRELKEEIRGRR